MTEEVYVNEHEIQHEEMRAAYYEQEDLKQLEREDME